MSNTPVLAVDIGGSKTLAALVDRDRILESVTVPTDRRGTPDVWLGAVDAATLAWRDTFRAVGIAVTGRVHEGTWSALNPDTLNIPTGTPLLNLITARWQRPCAAMNDAQAAAWGEYLYGAGAGEDCVYLTVSTGLGGGIVSHGKLLTGRGGIAGHFGQIATSSGVPLETMLSGRGVTRRASAGGMEGSAQEVFARASDEPEAAEVVEGVVQSFARLCRDVQLMLDPPTIVVGGGIGLAEGFLPRVNAALSRVAPVMRPRLVPAALGEQSATIGISAIAASAHVPDLPTATEITAK